MTTYSLTKVLASGEAWITASTDDVTDNLLDVKITATADSYVLPQYSSDSEVTWTDHSEGAYRVNATTDRRVITIPDEGVVRLEIANNAASSNTLTVVITANTVTAGGVAPEDVYRAAGISSSVISRADCISAILRAESEGRQMTGRPLTAETVSEEYYGNNKKSLFLDHTPLISVSSLTIGTSTITTTYIDVVTDIGKITLTSDAETTRFTLPSSETPTQYDRNVAITYVWGYSTAPYWYKRLVECLAGIIILTQQTGGTYDDVTSYSVGDVSASLGEPYMNIRATADALRKEVDEIMKNVKKAVAVF